MSFAGPQTIWKSLAKIDLGRSLVYFPGLMIILQIDHRNRIWGVHDLLHEQLYDGFVGMPQWPIIEWLSRSAPCSQIIRMRTVLRLRNFRRCREWGKQRISSSQQSQERMQNVAWFDNHVSMCNCCCCSFMDAIYVPLPGPLADHVVS